MTYKEYVLEVFTEHHNCMGLSQEEIEDMINDTPIQKIEFWLVKAGYDLNEYYL